MDFGVTVSWSYIWNLVLFQDGELRFSTNYGVLFSFTPCLVLFLARILTKSFFYKSCLPTCSADCIL